MSDYTTVGQSLPRVDGVEKATGAAKYGADIQLPGMLWGRFVRSPHPHARIKRIDTRKAEKIPGVKAILTHKSLTADQALSSEDTVHAMKSKQGLFASDKVRYQGEKIAVVAATDPDIADDAVEAIEVEYEILPGVNDVLEAIKPGAPLIFEEKAPVTTPDGKTLYNICNESHNAFGDVDRAFAESDIIIEDAYNIPRVHQTYMEPHAVVANVDGHGNVTVWTSTQGIFAIRSGVASSLGIPISKVNVIGMTIGGGFGAKFGMLIHPYAVLLSQRTRRPVKIVMDRHEEFVDGRPAPGCWIWVKTGAKKDGTILARQAISYWNTGVTSGASLGQTSRIRGVYKIPNIKYDAYGVYTNEPGPAAYRAPGAPQVTFASEAQLDRLSEILGMDPVELRLKNMAEDGDSVAGGRPLSHVAFKETLTAVAEKVDWKNRKKGKNRGWGVAVGEWTNGAGPAGAYVSLHEDGSVKVFSGLMDITGTDTAMAQIAAEVLGVPFEKVSVIRGDTNSAPYTTGSGGSVITFSVGNAVKRAAEDARTRVLEIAAQQLEARPEDLILADGMVAVKGGGKDALKLAEVAQASLSNTGGPIVGKGSFAREPSHTVISAQIAEVEVDTGTGQVKLLRLAGALDCGTAVNPVQVTGQMEGGAVQGASWGLMEQTKYSPSRGNLNPHLLDYQIPTALDVPTLESVIVEKPSAHGPFGVKGVGEPPITPTLAAIANAVYDAVGVRVNDMPLTPERVLFALKAKKNGGNGHNGK